MQNLRAILKLVQYPDAYSRLARPSAIGGCIKLMSGIKFNGKYLPFSYEYGYLCFRVLTVVLGVCILQRSDQPGLDYLPPEMAVDAQANPQLDIMQILGHYVSVTIFQELSSKDESRLNWIVGWINVEGRPKQPPLATIPDIELLSAMLWDDRKSFFKALKSTYYPGISAVIFVLLRMNRRERDPIMPHLTTLNEIAFRYYLIATSDQQHAISYMKMDIGAGKHLASWERNTQLVDLEDCREVVGAYVARFNPHPILYYPISLLDGPIFLRSLAQFVVPGTEDLLPAVLGVTAKRIWEEIKDPSEEYKPDVYVDGIRDTFTNYTTIIQSRTFSRMNDTLFQELVDNIIKHDLIDLAARAMLLLELPSEPPAHHLARITYPVSNASIVI
ncbi:hypothetical protein FRC11_003569 [Ceratobasidium sp. 423]|nr:hypothetical protein FRC11_003569 [Ceratobasidium sp. 423]